MNRLYGVIAIAGLLGGFISACLILFAGIINPITGYWTLIGLPVFFIFANLIEVQND